MTAVSPRQQEQSQQHRDTVAAIGGWLFTHRTAVSLPLAIALLAVRPGLSAAPAWLVTGGLLVASGELLRLWAVRHVGVISRTRSTRIGPLISSGPFGLVRNPMYLGNIALWAGFAVSARLPWVAVIIVLALALEYTAIVRWEEQLLDARIGDPYRRYAASVPRWLPRSRDLAGAAGRALHPWRDTLFSERGTLIAIAVGYALLWTKTVV